MKQNDSKTNVVQNNKFVCSICGKVSYGYGNNPWPVVKDDNARCCDHCNWVYVIPARIAKHAD